MAAPGFTDEALEILTQKKNIRLLRIDGISEPCVSTYTAKKVDGGLLVQEPDSLLLDESELKVVTKRAPQSRK